VLLGKFSISEIRTQPAVGRTGDIEVITAFGDLLRGAIYRLTIGYARKLTNLADGGRSNLFARIVHLDFPSCHGS
jgi:hypothetical protein